MKRTLSLFLCILLLVSGWTIPALAEAPTKISILAANDNSVWDPVGNPAIAKILADNNVEIELNHADDITQAINLQMASGELSDLIVAPKFTFLEYINTGYLMELTDLLDQYGPEIKKQISQQGWDYVTLDGGIWAIPQENLNSKYVTTIRMDWVEKLGFEVKEVYTLSELKEMLIAFAKNDPDGNGVDDTYGMNAHGGGLESTPMAIYGAFGGVANQNYLNENNEIYAFNTSEGFRGALTYLNELWVAGAIDPEFFVATGEQAKIKAANGKIGYFTGWWNAVKEACESGFVELNPEEAIFKKIYITSDDGTMQGVKDNGLITNTTLISANCENPEKVMQFMNYLFTDEGYHLACHGMEGVHYEFDETGRVNNIFAQNQDWDPLGVLVRRMDQVRFNDSFPLAEDADKGARMIYETQMIQYAENQALYADLFYGLPATAESLEYSTELTNYVVQKVVEFVTGTTPINDETWAAYKTEWAAKGGIKVMESYAKAYNELHGTDYAVAK